MTAPVGLIARFLVCVALATGTAGAQTVEDRYLAARDAAIERFTPERVPNVGQREMDDEAKARAELDRLIRAVLGSQTPDGFDAGQFNVTTLFSGDIDFGRLDGLSFEADGGDTRMVISTRSLLTKWLQAKWQDPKERVPPDTAMKSEVFYLRALGSDAAILRYADIPIGAENAFAILGSRTQDTPPFDADEVFLTAIRGDRVFVASARVEPALSVAACTKSREAAEAKLAEMERAEIKPGPRNAAALERVIELRDRIETDFKRCFAERAPKEPGFANAVKRAKDMLARMQVK
ncbi:MAG: hypothetical protein ACO1NY_14600 [Pseudorhodoplanes sp.]